MLFFIVFSKCNTLVADLNAVSALQHLHNPDKLVRVQACIALGLIRDRSTVTPLIKLLQTEDDPQVRQNVVKSLGLLGDESALPFLQTVSSLLFSHYKIKFHYKYISTDAKESYFVRGQATSSLDQILLIAPPQPTQQTVQISQSQPTQLSQTPKFQYDKPATKSQAKNDKTKVKSATIDSFFKASPNKKQKTEDPPSLPPKPISSQTTLSQNSSIRIYEPTTSSSNFTSSNSGFTSASKILSSNSTTSTSTSTSTSTNNSDAKPFFNTNKHNGYRTMPKSMLEQLNNDNNKDDVCDLTLDDDNKTKTNNTTNINTNNNTQNSQQSAQPLFLVSSYSKHSSSNAMSFTHNPSSSSVSSSSISSASRRSEFSSNSNTSKSSNSNSNSDSSNPFFVSSFSSRSFNSNSGATVVTKKTPKKRVNPQDLKPLVVSFYYLSF